MTDGEILIALGTHDLDIARSERALDALPEKQAILRLRHRLKEIEAVLEQAEAYRRKAEALVSRKQDEAASVAEKIDAEQAKVLSGMVTNPKELQNLTREIAALDRRKSALEHEALGLMEKAEAAIAQVEKVRVALEEGHAKEVELIDRFREKGGELQREIERLKAERSLLVSKLPKTLVERYDSVRSAKHGIGVGVLQPDGLCSACRTQLPASRAQDIESGPEIAECPNCRRVLVVRKQGSA
jgi:predicted  nucleic acid-binding Zn-ribbon protein